MVKIDFFQFLEDYILKTIIDFELVHPRSNRPHTNALLGIIIIIWNTKKKVGSTFEVKLGERRVVTCCKHTVAAARDSKFKVVSASYGY